MGHVSFSIPKDIVLRFKEKGGISSFIETGTYKGGTCFWAAHHFDKVYSIEIDPIISKETSSRPDCPPNIQFFVGNSKDVLPELVSKVHERSLFWLDGHWCDISDLGKDMECPLLDELRSLKDFNDSVILIDDARAFLGPLPPPHDSSQWPGIDEIILLLKNQFPKNFVTIVDDVIFCIPPDLKGVFDIYWKESFAQRFAARGNTLTKKAGNALKRLGIKK